MTGYCSHCLAEGEVARFRIPDLGLRFLDEDCHSRLDALGMVLIPVSDRDPRQPVPGRRVAWTDAVRRDWLGRGWLSSRASRAA